MSLTNIASGDPPMQAHMWVKDGPNITVLGATPVPEGIKSPGLVNFSASSPPNPALISVKAGGELFTIQGLNFPAGKPIKVWLVKDTGKLATIDPKVVDNKTITFTAPEFPATTQSPPFLLEVLNDLLLESAESPAAFDPITIKNAHIWTSKLGIIAVGPTIVPDSIKSPGLINFPATSPPNPALVSAKPGGELFSITGVDFPVGKPIKVWLVKDTGKLATIDPKIFNDKTITFTAPEFPATTQSPPFLLEVLNDLLLESADSPAAFDPITIKNAHIWTSKVAITAVGSTGVPAPIRSPGLIDFPATSPSNPALVSAKPGGELFSITGVNFPVGKPIKLWLVKDTGKLETIDPKIFNDKTITFTAPEFPEKTQSPPFLLDILNDLLLESADSPAAFEPITIKNAHIWTSKVAITAVGSTGVPAPIKSPERITFPATSPPNPALFSAKPGGELFSITGVNFPVGKPIKIWLVKDTGKLETINPKIFNDKTITFTAPEFPEKTQSPPFLLDVLNDLLLESADSPAAFEPITIKNAHIWTSKVAITAVGSTGVPAPIKSPERITFPATSPPNPALVSAKPGGELFSITGVNFPVGKPIKVWLVKDTGKLETIDPKIFNDKTITFTAPEFPEKTQSPPFLLDVLNDLLLESADSPQPSSRSRSRTNRVTTHAEPVLSQAHIWTSKVAITAVGSTGVPAPIKSPERITFPATSPPNPALVSAKPGGELFSITGVNFPVGKPIKLWLVKDTGKLETINPKIFNDKTITFTAPEFPEKTQSPPFLLDVLNDLLLESADSPAAFEPITIKNAHIWTSKVAIIAVGSTGVPAPIKSPERLTFPATSPPNPALVSAKPGGELFSITGVNFPVGKPIKLWLVKDTGKLETIDPKIFNDKTITFTAPEFPEKTQSPPFLLDILNDLLLESADSPAAFEPITIKNAHIWTSKVAITAVGSTGVPAPIKSPERITFPATLPPNPALVSAKPGGELFSITGVNFPVGKPIKLWLVKDTGKLETIDPKIFNDKTITFTAPEFPEKTQSPPFLLDILNDLLLESADSPAAFEPITIKNAHIWTSKVAITAVGSTGVPAPIKSPERITFPATSPPNPALVSAKPGGELFSITGVNFPVGKPIKVWLVKDTGKLETIDPKIFNDKSITFTAPEFPEKTQSPPFLLDILNDLLLESAESPAAFEPITIKNAHIWTSKVAITTVGSTGVPAPIKSPERITFPATSPPNPALVSAKPGGELFSITGVNFPVGKPIKLWLVKDTGKLATIDPKVVDNKTITFTAPEFPATTQSPPFLLEVLNDLLLESAESPAAFDPITIKNAHIWTSKLGIIAVGPTIVPDSIKSPGLINFPATSPPNPALVSAKPGGELFSITGVDFPVGKPIKVWLVKDTGKLATIDPKIFNDKTITFTAPEFPATTQSPPFLLEVLNDLLLESADSPAAFDPITIKNAHIWTSKVAITAVGSTGVPAPIRSPGLIDFPATSPSNPALVSAKPGGELFSITGVNFPVGKPIKLWLVKDTGKLETIDPKIFNDKTITFTAPEFPEKTQSPPFLLDILNDLLLESADSPAAFEPITIKNAHIWTSKVAITAVGSTGVPAPIKSPERITFPATSPPNPALFSAKPGGELFSITGVNFPVGKPIKIWLVKDTGKLETINPKIFNDKTITFTAPEFPEKTQSPPFLLDVLNDLLLESADSPQPSSRSRSRTNRVTTHAEPVLSQAHIWTSKVAITAVGSTGVPAPIKSPERITFPATSPPNPALVSAKPGGELFSITGVNFPVGKPIKVWLVKDTGKLETIDPKIFNDKTITFTAPEFPEKTQSPPFLLDVLNDLLLESADSPAAFEPITIKNAHIWTSKVAITAVGSTGVPAPIKSPERITFPATSPPNPALVSAKPGGELFSITGVNFPVGKPIKLWLVKDTGKLETINPKIFNDKTITFTAPEFPEKTQSPPFLLDILNDLLLESADSPAAFEPIPIKNAHIWTSKVAITAVGSTGVPAPIKSPERITFPATLPPNPALVSAKPGGELFSITGVNFPVGKPIKLWLVKDTGKLETIDPKIFNDKTITFTAPEFPEKTQSPPFLLDILNDLLLESADSPAAFEPITIKNAHIWTSKVAITAVGSTGVPAPIKSPERITFPATSPPNPALVSAKVSSIRIPSGTLLLKLRISDSHPAGGELFSITGVNFPVGKPIKVWLVKDTGKLETIDPKIFNDKSITFTAPEFPEKTQSPPFLLDILNDLLLESAESPAAFEPITIKNAHIWTSKVAITTVGSTGVPAPIKSPERITFPATSPPNPALVSAKPGGELFSITGVNFPVGKPIKLWLVKDTGKLETINPKIFNDKTITFTAPEFPEKTQSPPFLLDVLNDLLLESADSPAAFEPITIKNAHIWTSKVAITAVGSTGVPAPIKSPERITFPATSPPNPALVSSKPGGELFSITGVNFPAGKPIKVWIVKDTGKVEAIEPKVVDAKTITFKAPAFPDAQSPPFLLDVLNDLLLESADSPAAFEPITIKNAHIWTSKVAITAVGSTGVPAPIKSPERITFPATSPPNPALVSAKPGGELFSITGVNFPAGKPIKVWIVKDTGKVEAIEPKVVDAKTITFKAPPFPDAQSPPFLMDILNDLLLESADSPAAFDPITIKNAHVWQSKSPLNLVKVGETDVPDSLKSAGGSYVNLPEASLYSLKAGGEPFTVKGVGFPVGEPIRIWIVKEAGKVEAINPKIVDAKTITFSASLAAAGIPSPPFQLDILNDLILESANMPPNFVPTVIKNVGPKDVLESQKDLPAGKITLPDTAPDAALISGRAGGETFQLEGMSFPTGFPITVTIVKDTGKVAAIDPKIISSRVITFRAPPFPSDKSPPFQINVLNDLLLESTSGGFVTTTIFKAHVWKALPRLNITRAANTTFTRDAEPSADKMTGSVVANGKRQIAPHIKTAADDDKVTVQPAFLSRRDGGENFAVFGSDLPAGKNVRITLIKETDGKTGRLDVLDPKISSSTQITFRAPAFPDAQSPPFLMDKWNDLLIWSADGEFEASTLKNAHMWKTDKITKGMKFTRIVGNNGSEVINDTAPGSTPVYRIVYNPDGSADLFFPRPFLVSPFGGGDVYTINGENFPVGEPINVKIIRDGQEIDALKADFVSSTTLVFTAPQFPGRRPFRGRKLVQLLTNFELNKPNDVRVTSTADPPAFDPVTFKDTFVWLPINPSFVSPNIPVSNLDPNNGGSGDPDSGKPRNLGVILGTVIPIGLVALAAAGLAAAKANGALSGLGAGLFGPSAGSAYTTTAAPAAGAGAGAQGGYGAATGYPGSGAGAGPGYGGPGAGAGGAGGVGAGPGAPAPSPLAPSSLQLSSASAAGSGSATLSWSPPAAGAPASYQIMQNGAAVGSVPGFQASAPISGLAANSPAVLQVVPVDASGVAGPPSYPMSAVVGSPSGFGGGAPVLTAAPAAANGSSAVLNWTAASAAAAAAGSGFAVLANGRQIGTAPASPAGAGSFVAKGLPTGGPVALSVGPLSPSAAAAGAAPSVAAPLAVYGASSGTAGASAAALAPSGLQLTNVSLGMFGGTSGTLSWSRPQAGAPAAFQVLRNGQVAASVPGGQTSIDVSSLPKDGTAVFQVAPVDENGAVGPASPPLAAGIPSSSGGVNLAVTSSASGTEAALAWTAAASASVAGFAVLVNGNKTATVPAGYGGSNYTFAARGLNPNAASYFRVVPVSADGAVAGEASKDVPALRYGGGAGARGDSGAPRNLRVREGRSGELALSWDHPETYRRTPVAQYEASRRLPRRLLC
eukprot:tig00000396_g24884.t1